MGSVTLYDSPNFNKANANPNHKYAMQPIVLKTVNAEGFGDYQQGISPDIEQLENYSNLGIIADVNEPLLQTTLNLISAGGRLTQQPFIEHEFCSDSKKIEPLRNDMYLELK